MRKKIFISVIAVSIFIIALLAILNSKNDGMENTKKVSIYYKTYTNNGWSKWSKNGITSGTVWAWNAKLTPFSFNNNPSKPQISVKMIKLTFLHSSFFLIIAELTLFEKYTKEPKSVDDKIYTDTNHKPAAISSIHPNIIQLRQYAKILFGLYSTAFSSNP